MHELDEDTALSVLFANTKRKKRQVDLITIAQSCQYLANLYGSKLAVAERIGLHTEMIRQFMSLLELPEEVKSLVSSRKIDRLDVAYRIAMLRDPAQQIAVAESLANLASSKDIRDVMRLVRQSHASVEESTKRVMDAKPQGLHILVMDFDDEEYRAIRQKAKDLKIGPAELAKQIIEEWLYRKDQERTREAR